MSLRPHQLVYIIEKQSYVIFNGDKAPHGQQEVDSVVVALLAGVVEGEEVALVQLVDVGSGSNEELGHPEEAPATRLVENRLGVLKRDMKKEMGYCVWS